MLKADGSPAAGKFFLSDSRLPLFITGDEGAEVLNKG